MLQKQEVTWKQRVEIAFAIAKAMSFLHGRGIIHRDLKCENILLTTDFDVKVCDFGFARKIDRSSKTMTICGTDWTMAPEIIMENLYNEKADVFSYGMILAEVLSGFAPDMKNFARQMPDFGINPDEVSDKALSGAPPKLIEVAMQCVQLDSHIRPSFVEVVQDLQEVMNEEGFSMWPLRPPFSFLRRIQELNHAPISFTRSPEVIQGPLPCRIVRSGGQRDQRCLCHVGSPLDFSSLFFFFFRHPASPHLFLLLPCSRLDNRNPEGEPVFLYQITNKRANDVMVNIEMTGSNTSLTPLGTAESISDGRIIEGVVRKGQEVLLGQLEALDPSKPMDSNCTVQVERSDSEIREDDVQGVVLITSIEHGYTRQVSFFAYNKNAFDVDVNVSVEGKFLSTSCELPIKKFVPSKQKLFLGSLKTSGNMATSWGWAQVPKKTTETVQVLKGVHLVVRPVGNSKNQFQVEVSNNRRRGVRAQVKLIGKYTPASAGVLVGDVRPTETVLLGTYTSDGKVEHEWSWKEL